MSCNKCGQPLPKAICLHCGKEFDKVRKDKVYCSRKCKALSSQKRKRSN
jgi:predicted nucleic acid-binding Zn ribbon protein